MDKSKIKKIAINFLIPLICVGTSTLLFLVFVYPSFKKIPQLEQELKANESLRNLLKDKSAKLNKIVDFKEVVAQDSDLVNRVMPSEQNVPGLLDQLDQISKESGLEVNRLSYSVSDVDGKSDGIESYKVVLVSLGADGTYDQMASFIRALEGSARMVEVSSFRFSAINPQEPSKLSFTFILSAPYLQVQSSAVTDEPLALDISSQDFVTFINKVKALRYFEKSGDELSFVVETAEEVQETTQSSSSGQ